MSILGIELSRRQIEGGMNTPDSHRHDDSWEVGDVPDILLTPRARRRTSQDAPRTATEAPSAAQAATRPHPA